MKEWALSVILLSIFGKLTKHFLPKGEKSSLFSPLRLLLSLTLIVALIFPLQRLKTPLEAKELSIQYEDAETLSGNALILEKMGKTIKKSVDTAFPACEYALEICVDKEGIPQSIRVIGGGEKAFEISKFIQENYGLEVTTDQGGTQNEAR